MSQAVCRRYCRLQSRRRRRRPSPAHELAHARTSPGPFARGGGSQSSAPTNPDTCPHKDNLSGKALGARAQTLLPRKVLSLVRRFKLARFRHSFEVNEEDGANKCLSCCVEGQGAARRGSSKSSLQSARRRSLSFPLCLAWAVLATLVRKSSSRVGMRWADDRHSRWLNWLRSSRRVSVNSSASSVSVCVPLLLGSALCRHEAKTAHADEQNRTQATARLCECHTMWRPASRPACQTRLATDLAELASRLTGGRAELRARMY